MITNTSLPDLVAPSHTGGPLLGPMNQIEHEILSKPLEEEFASSLNVQSLEGDEAPSFATFR